MMRRMLARIDRLTIPELIGGVNEYGGDDTDKGGPGAQFKGT